jgi:hypothetical protein
MISRSFGGFLLCFPSYIIDYDLVDKILPAEKNRTRTEKIVEKEKRVWNLCWKGKQSKRRKRDILGERLWDICLFWWYYYGGGK